LTAGNIEAAVARAIIGTPDAVKRGRTQAWPYVPIIRLNHATGFAKTQQIMGKAFAAREEAIAYAARVIEARRADMRQKLIDPRYRALREQFGLPREIEPTPFDPVRDVPGAGCV
jgi:hypothetical protein